MKSSKFSNQKLAAINAVLLVAFFLVVSFDIKDDRSSNLKHSKAHIDQIHDVAVEKCVSETLASLGSEVRISIGSSRREGGVTYVEVGWSRQEYYDKLFLKLCIHDAETNTVLFSKSLSPFTKNTELIFDGR